MELSKTYDPKAAEERWFQRWIELGYFKADPRRPGPVFSIVIPPPNVTGQLHLGHALNATLHDVIVRTRRMQGYNTLWLPGTDHAGIATQNVVERELAREGKSRHDLGREAFVERVWRWRETYGGRILHQLKRLGASCDWSRERFTLDEGLSRAVVEVFVRLYREGLIYRGRRLINWCPRCETALSDLEVDHRDTEGRLYYIRYPLVGADGAVTVATTRPETMLGDTGVAVHPEDPRFAGLVGRTVTLPLAGREIPIIADSAVARDFGTGAVKITPAHDFDDFEIGRRHGLGEVVVIDLRGRMSDAAGRYAGMTREDCRRRVLEDLDAQGLLERVEPHRHAVGICSRCDTVVEPALTWQWFVRVETLARAAMAAVRDGRTRFRPQFWENTYFSWMENLQDWCISRQLWWGHRIPAYWCGACGHLMVMAEQPERCERCGAPQIRQEEDVLDTWFSSGLWPFSTLGWPERTADLERYYPTSLLITGFDIIFFWVARMMMMGLKCTGEVPFREVYVTPLVRDEMGRKMTKSRGNVIDPLEIIDRYGTDAVRFTFAQLAIAGRDLVLSDDRLAASRAFANKVWNAARFVLLNLKDSPAPLAAPADLSKLELAQRWVLDRLNDAVRDATAAIDRYEFNTAALTLYQFIWHCFCDWFIELCKEPLKAGGARAYNARWTLTHCLDALQRALHPFMPFLTEEIWQALRPYIEEPGLAPHLAIAAFPKAAESPLLSAAERVAMSHCVEAAEAINSLRSLLGLHPAAPARAFIRQTSGTNLAALRGGFGAWQRYAMTLARAERLEIAADGAAAPGASVTAVLAWGEVLVEAPENFDFEAARRAVQKKLAKARGYHEQQLGRLKNPEFLAKAAAETREEVESRASQLEEEMKLLEQQLQLLGGA